MDAAEPDRRESTRARRPGRVRMSGADRREQLIEISRGLFAARGFDGTSVEEIAAKAEVSKPVIYEHFGARRACTRSSSTARSGRCWTASGAL